MDIDYPEKLNRITTFFRFIPIIPVAIVFSLLTATGSETVTSRSEGRGRPTGLLDAKIEESKTFEDMLSAWDERQKNEEAN